MRKNILGSIVLLGLLVIGIGCYETKFPVGSQVSGSVNTAYVGDFSRPSDAGKSTTVIIRNVDDKSYYVEFKDENGEISRFFGFTGDVKGTTFANLRTLTDDGSIPDTFALMRVAISQDHSQLTMQSLKDDFFRDKSIDSSEKQRQVISDNIDNKDMYDGDPVIFTRVKAEKK